MFSKFFKQLFRNKFTTAITLLVVIIGGYLGYQGLTGGTSVVEYVTAPAEQGTLVLSISGSGQVSVSGQADITPKVSGEIVAVYIAQGQEIKAGTLLAQIDSRDAQKAVRDAERNLRTAEIQMEELYRNTMDTKQEAEDSLEKAHEDAFNTITNTFLDLSPMIIGLHNITSSYEIADSETSVVYDWNTAVLLRSISSYGPKYYELEAMIGKTQEDYKVARKAYDESFESYKNASRYSEKDVTEVLLKETQEATRTIAELIKSETNLLDVWVDYSRQSNLPVFSKVSEYQLNLNSYTLKINNHLSSLLSIQRTIEDNKETGLDAEQDLIEMDNDDPNNLNIWTAKVNIQQKEDALLATKETLADHFIRAPFDGVVAKVNVKKGDSASSGTILAILITKQKIAEVTLNEIDVAKVEINQPATLTFDAIENVTLTGRVVEIDTLGMVTQGIVTYGVKIAFDTQDERIKPGMTTNASIVTERKDGIVLVPNAAVQTQGGQIFVEVMQDGIPQSVTVEVGLSNEVSTEIVNGLQDGAEIVIARLGGEGGTQTANISQPFRFPGFGGSGGGFRGGGGSDQH